MAATYYFHEIADIFPMMTGEDFDRLKADILEHGLIEPIVLHEGRILDGRNRYVACKEFGTPIKTKQWNGKGSPVDYVISMNLHRRHLTPTQRAAIALPAKEQYAEEAKDRQLSGKSSDGGAGGRGRKKNPVAKLPQGLAAPLPPTGNGEPVKPKPEPKARDRAASALGVSPRMVQDAEAVKKKDPKLVDAMRKGDITLADAKRQTGVGQPTTAPNGEPSHIKVIKKHWVKCTKPEKKNLWQWLEANY